jgi:hypothetical protein
MRAIYFDLSLITIAVGMIVYVTMFGGHWPRPH